MGSCSSTASTAAGGASRKQVRNGPAGGCPLRSQSARIPCSFSHSSASAVRVASAAVRAATKASPAGSVAGVRPRRRGRSAVPARAERAAPSTSQARAASTTAAASAARSCPSGGTSARIAGGTASARRRRLATSSGVGNGSQRASNFACCPAATAGRTRPRATRSSANPARGAHQAREGPATTPVPASAPSPPRRPARSRTTAGSMVTAGTVHGPRVGRPLGYRGGASRTTVGDGRGRDRLPGRSNVISPLPAALIPNASTPAMRRSPVAAKG